ncbi:hypothetical protein [Rhabdothermincola salaria]|uniref:hypothetical protein n=1 Tax=Rhabdothermincola salaria TaxID=2903142 RepID=UPI001E620CF1|nr:hypothetical protein [Rhabdothermincola salaria]MCD9625218.1 hypothetical protein [Rhabdothermincola salaria]
MLHARRRELGQPVLGDWLSDSARRVGPTVTVRFSGRNWHDEELLAYEHTFAVPPLG